MDLIYLDHNATTPVDPEVREAMLPFLGPEFGNPSSAHPLGRKAREAVERARAEVADLIGAQPREIIFTASGTEASQLALLGCAEARRERLRGRRLRIVSFALEHPATLRPLEELRRRGDEVILIPPDPRGVVQTDRMHASLDERSGSADIVSLMHAHNETGVLQPVAETGRLARAGGILFHVDAAQTLAKVPVNVEGIGCDLLSIAGHKIYAPKGVGALYVRSGTALRPLLPGAGQEGGLRGGTENVPGIVALGAACQLAKRRLAGGEPMRLAALRERLWEGLRAAVPGIARTGQRAETLPNTLHVRFPNARGNAVLEAAPQVAASTGSACHSGIDKPPAAIIALGIPEEEALGSVRLSLGHGTDAAAVDTAVAHLARGWRIACGGNENVPGR